MNETKTKCPKCQKEDMFDVGYSRRAGELPHRHSVISLTAANRSWLWFGCDRCGIYVVEFNIKGLIDKFKEIRSKMIWNRSLKNSEFYPNIPIRDNEKEEQKFMDRNTKGDK